MLQTIKKGHMKLIPWHSLPITTKKSGMALSSYNDGTYEK
jgi:hypothetical protein